MDVVHVNFSTAFDKIPRGRLIQKMKILGIHGHLVWNQNGHTHRRKRVSFWLESLTSGFLQGSVVGLLLFAIYINDLEANVDGLVSVWIVVETKIIVDLRGF